MPETNTRRRVRFLEHITSHISSVLSTEDCKSSIHSQLQESLLPAGVSLSPAVIEACLPYKLNLLLFRLPLQSGPWWQEGRAWATGESRHSISGGLKVHLPTCAGVSAAVGEQKAQGCTCGQPGLACTCSTNGHHEKSLATGHENGHMESCHHETGHKGGRAQRTARSSPFAEVDLGMGVPGTPGAHGSVCSCQRCNHDSPDVPESSLSGDGGKSMQAAATPGPALVLHSDADRREFISAGAAAGLAVFLPCGPLLIDCAPTLFGMISRAASIPYGIRPVLST